jgi:mannose-1-phosphate guanylyltransferase
MRGLILCAGLGERLRPITASVAKPAVRFLNIPMLAYPLFWLEQLGVKSLVLNTHHLPETVEHAMKSVSDWAVDVKYRFEPQILGSGGAIWNARDDLQGDREFITMNGDAVFFMDRKKALGDMLEFHKRSSPLATLLVCEYPGVGDTIPGVWIDSGNHVVNFGKDSSPHSKCFHYTGVAIFSERVFEMLPKGPSNILYDVLLKAIRGGDKVNVWKEPMRWFETGKPSEYLSATHRCLQMLSNSEATQWHLVDILDRYSPGWRGFTQEGLTATAKPDFPFSISANARVLLGNNVHSKQKVNFKDICVVCDNANLESSEGVYIPEAASWIR